MTSNWYTFIRKYVWNDDKTPYLIKVDKLNRRQAKSELFIYTWFLASLYGMWTLVAIAKLMPADDLVDTALTFYCLSMFLTALFFGLTKNPYAALYSVSAPLMACLILVTNALATQLSTLDKWAVATVCLLWLRYTWRVLAITRAFEDMPEGPPDNKPKRF
jgi:hypothetical protein